MAATNVLSTLRRSTKPVSDVFRNAQLYRTDGVARSPEMVVLFTWLGAKQKYANKYANCWTQRGHDVLHITCSVRDLLFPRTGAEVTASRTVDYLAGLNKDVIIHGLSVGGYLTSRVLMEARDSTVSISHQIFDSFTNTVGIERGVQNAVHPRYKDIATKCMRMYSKYADLSSINEALHFLLTTPCPAPTLYIHSMADKVAYFSELEGIITSQSRVSPVTTYLIPAEQEVPHVTLMKCLGEDKYMGLIDNFVEKHRGQVSAREAIPAAPASPCANESQEKLVLH